MRFGPATNSQCHRADRGNSDRWRRSPRDALTASWPHIAKFRRIRQPYVSTSLSPLRANDVVRRRPTGQGVRMIRDFRFSFNVFGIPSPRSLQELCRRGESVGFHTVFAADHLGAPAPFPVLVAAADATERLRVGTLVLNTPFWNPALLAREVASTDILTGGWLELGLGAGHMKWEFDAAGIPWTSFGSRARALEKTITELERFFSG